MRKTRSKYHQLILPIEYRAQAMVMLHNEYGHQGVECTVALVWERFYWGTMLYDVQSWVKNCQCCKTAKGPYTDPEPPQGSIVANNPVMFCCALYDDKCLMYLFMLVYS